MPPTPPTIEQTLTALREAPAHIATATASLTPAQLQAAPSAGEWSLAELVGHLRASADIWGGAIQRIVAEDHPAFTAISPRTWIRRTNYPTLDFAPSFAAYQTQRAALLALLAGLPPAAWERIAIVTANRKATERSVASYAAALARHEQAHLAQIAHTAEALRRAQ